MDGIYTDIEKIVIDWLTRHNIEFQFQTSIKGGFFELGGAVVDFLIPDLWLAWRVQGEHWHRGIAPEGRDLIQREMLAEMGYTVVDLWGEDITNKTNETLTKAMLGEEMLR